MNAVVKDSLSDELAHVYLGSYGIMYSIIYSRTRSRELAKEVIQEAFIKFLENPPKEVKTYEGYLMKTALNIAINKMKAVTARRKIDQLLSFKVDPELRTPERILASKQEVERIRERLERLPYLQQSIVVLVGQDGLSFDEAGEKLGIHQRKVRRIFASALKFLEQFLDEDNMNR